MNLTIQKIKQKIGSYQLDDVKSKIELRRAQIFNFSILIECVVLIVNCVRHFLEGSYNSAIIVGFTAVFLLFLYATKFITKTNKYLILIILGLVFTFLFTHYIDKSKDIIQVYLAVLVATGLFLNGKRFYVLFFATILVYYFTFFNLGYQKIYNPFGALTFMALTLMVRLFLRDAEKNEVIIDKQVNELKEIDNQKTRLFANISHEIRTPLTLILGANEQTENTKQSQIIRKNSLRMLELVNQILDLSKIEAKQRKIQLSEINLISYFNDLVSSYQNLSEIKNIGFKFKDNSFLETAFVDKDALNKIVSNLLLNAFKFSSEKDNVSLLLEQNKNKWLKITVSDTGKGIEEDKIQHIFNQFYHSTVGLEASSGIGLALVKELVESFGGQVLVQSKENVGSVFVVELPVELSQFQKLNIEYEICEKTTETQPEIEILPVRETETKQTETKDILLLVEDNDDLRLFVKEILQDKYQVVEALNGEEGINKALEIIPDIILSDVMMPKVSGLQLLETLKQDVKTSHIPIILLTAKSDENDVLAGLQLEADDYITKPFNENELLLRLKNKLSLRKKIQNQYQKIEVRKYHSDEIVSKEDKFLQSIYIAVKKNLSNSDFGPDELAQEIGLSVSQVFRKLKALTNLSTSIYIRNIRLEEAKILLVNQSATISEIAYETGFSTPTYFGKCFKEYTSFSPKEFIGKHI